MNNTDTIAAIATPPGRGGIGVVRVSGKKALVIAENILGFHPKVRFAHFCPFNDNNNVIDHGIAIYFKAPNSFTGEDVLELQAHGGPIILDQLLQACLQLGARIAKPGEFSLQAFLNDKLDLAQAEAIADLINANSAQAARSALRSLQGEFSDKINELLQQLIRLRMYVEAAIDFPEEEVDFLQDQQVTESLKQLIAQIATVFDAAKQGVLLQEGMTVVIMGRPNAGKSSLLNRLSGRDSAIVTAVAGTTRDVVREHLDLDGLPLHIIDTAGLHDSQDEVEQIGIARAIDAIKKADLLLHVIDANDATTDLDLPSDVLAAIATLPKITVYNKIDLQPDIKLDAAGVAISAKHNQGIDQLIIKLKQVVGFQQTTEGQFIARRRHLDALEKTLQYLTTGQTQLQQHQAGELLAEDLLQAQQALGTITGAFHPDDLLGEIFSKFCIGK